MKYQKFLILLFCSVVLFSCKKTYEDGPNFSLRSKMNRISGKWKLVKMEGVTRLEPNIDQYVELFEDGKAIYTNFQERYITNEQLSYSDSSFSLTGSWEFKGNNLNGKCNGESEEITAKEGLLITLINNGYFSAGSFWKIKRLTNKDLVLFFPEWCYSADGGATQIVEQEKTLCFEKVKT